MPDHAKDDFVRRAENSGCYRSTKSELTCFVFVSIKMQMSFSNNLI